MQLMWNLGGYSQLCGFTKQIISIIKYTSNLFLFILLFVNNEEVYLTVFSLVDLKPDFAWRFRYMLIIEIKLINMIYI